jgi:hypothetical protein
VSIRPILQIFAHLTGEAFGILPKKKRFAAARRIALMIAPLLKRTPYFPRRPSKLDGPREESLRMMVRTMTRARVEFDPDVDIVGKELVAGPPVLIVSAHFLLNGAMTRWMIDSGRRLTMTLAGPREPMYYFGTTVPRDYHYAGPLLFLHMRRTLAEGGIGFVIAEESEPHENWLEVETAAGHRYVSPAVFTFAARTHTPIVFGATYLSPEGRVTVTYEQPRSTTAEAMTEEFCDFLRRHAAQVVR